MISVRELLNIDILQNNNTRILGHTIWYENRIKSVGIFEYEGIEDQYNLFKKGDLVLTTLMFARNNRDMANQSLMKLIDQKVSVIAIKDIYYDSVDPAVQDYADSNSVQLLIFTDISFEDIIIKVVNSIRRKEQMSYYEQRIDDLIKAQEKGERLRIIRDIDDSYYKNSICMYCAPNPSQDKDSKCILNKVIHSSCSKSIRELTIDSTSYYISIIRYRDGILVICTANQNTITDKNVSTVLECLGIYKNSFTVGKSNIYTELHCISYGVIEALSSYRYSKDYDHNDTDFKDIGIYQFILPLQENYWLSSFSNNTIQRIKEHDAMHDDLLLITAKEYIKNNGELKKTADSLYQHVNTIRYRLKKIRRILNIPEDNTGFYEHLYMAIKISELQPHNK